MPVDNDTIEAISKLLQPLQAQVAAVDSKMDTQLREIAGNLMSFQQGVDSRFQAFNGQLDEISKEQKRLAQEQVKQAQEHKAEMQRLKEELEATGAKTRRVGSPPLPPPTAATCRSTLPSTPSPTASSG